MSAQNIFIPKVQQSVEKIIEKSPELTMQNDRIGFLLLKLSQWAVVAFVALLPIFFIGNGVATLSFDKVLLSLGVSIIVLVAVMILALRRKSVTTITPATYILFALFSVSNFLSAFFSGDVQDAVTGSFFEIGTAGFVTLLAAVMLLPLILQREKVMTLRAIALFLLSAAVVLLHAVIRLIAGAPILSFAEFTTTTDSLVGSFNDLAIFAGLFVIGTMVTLLLIPLRSFLRIFIAVITLFALFLLATINFVHVWVLLALFSAVTTLYALFGKKLLQTSETKPTGPNLFFITLSGGVFLISAISLISGTNISERLNTFTNTNYVEVRPSLLATTKVVAQVYEEDALLGVGPNRFADAWRTHKDIEINDSIFWDTDFSNGYGLVPSYFVTLGVMGAFLFILFQIAYFTYSTITLLRTRETDSFWYFVAVIAFSISTYLWILTYVFTPSTTLLLLAALFTGLTYSALGSLEEKKMPTIALVLNRQRGFVGIMVLLLVVVGSVFVWQNVHAQFSAQTSFVRDGANENIIDTYEDSEFYVALAKEQANNLKALLSTSEATEESQKQFFDTSAKAVTYAKQAIMKDGTDAKTHAVLADIYGSLAVAGVDGAFGNAESALEDARKYDKINPKYALAQAQLSLQISDIQSAKKYINEALQLKSNYTEALQLQTQIAVAENDIDSAITATRAILIFEPQNPARYFQLGALLSTNKNDEEAVGAFLAAVQLNPNYANARYALALSYARLQNYEAAITELKIVQETNQTNELLQSLITGLESGTFEDPVDATVEKTFLNEENFTAQTPDTNLVAPVNQAGE